ncbi:glycoside hydrolase family 64 protein [Aulographum hederae CBS 113979]|uniref:Glycoside hydrolase family 64 protein n=1 Tax=Aulographum hederae CBS 113979 TaxID=1176131 RepID=A0A6G1GYP3_9PEZI|nr:glycoside hydrolase family 64 protein [Aulographum hederae CBS 113979]
MTSADLGFGSWKGILGVERALLLPATPPLRIDRSLQIGLEKELLYAFNSILLYAVQRLTRPRRTKTRKPGRNIASDNIITVLQLFPIMKSVMRFLRRKAKTPPKSGHPTSNQENKPHQPAAAEQASQQPINASATDNTLPISFVNQTSSSTVYAYITGQALDNGNKVFLLQADGKTPYYPDSTSETGTALAANCAIPLGAPGSTKVVAMPRLAGGRIWFSIDATLTFLVNPGPGLVEPSINNPTDPNINTDWVFCEFTYNSFQMFANISYVDFVSIPVALTLTSKSGSVQHVAGMDKSGFQTLCAALRAQSAKDGQPWANLIVKDKNGGDLRAISPQNGISQHPDWFSTYWTSYIDAVWDFYRKHDMTINTQAAAGNVVGRVNADNRLDFGNGISFPKPSSADIFTSNTGPFVTGSNPTTNAIIPRLAAAFNRSTLLLNGVTEFPNGVGTDKYYTGEVTNHFSRIVHEVNEDGRGYGFPYDDVTPDGGRGVEGAVFEGEPVGMVVTVGGA